MIVFGAVVLQAVGIQEFFSRPIATLKVGVVAVEVIVACEFVPPTKRALLATTMVTKLEVVEGRIEVWFS